MPARCDAIIGYLVPRQSCQNQADTACHKCRRAICHAHARLSPPGALCPTCALPQELDPGSLKQEVHFTEEDLQAFATAYQKQKGKKDPWVEFT